jgi:hypothetical protein
MTESLVFLTESNVERRKRILTVLRRIPDVSISAFDTLALTRKAMRSRRPDIMIGPWAQGGETTLAARATMVGNAALGPVPQLLLLTDRISPARISMARQAGQTELIPCDPLDYTGLYNRTMLVLHGDDALENMPALRKRLVA